MKVIKIDYHEDTSLIFCEGGRRVFRYEGVLPFTNWENLHAIIIREGILKLMKGTLKNHSIEVPYKELTIEEVIEYFL